MSSECYFHFSIIILSIVYLTLQFHLMFSFYRGDVSSPGYFHVAAVGVWTIFFFLITSTTQNLQNYKIVIEILTSIKIEP